MVLQFFIGEIYNFDPSNCENIIRRIQFPFRNELKVSQEQKFTAIIGQFLNGIGGNKQRWRSTGWIEEGKSQSAIIYQNRRRWRGR